MRQLLLCSLLILSAGLFAKTFTVPPMPRSAYADTEVSTNIVFNKHRSDVKKFELRFTLECTSSNCIQVAFGRDDDKDGVLSFAETDALYGWRNGRYVIEDVQNAVRYEENAVDAGSHVFSVAMKMHSDYTPKTFSAQVDDAAVLTNLAVTVPAWLYRPDWNLMRVTRRGAGASVEWCRCKIDYRHFLITIQ